MDLDEPQIEMEKKDKDEGEEEGDIKEEVVATEEEVDSYLSQVESKEQPPYLDISIPGFVRHIFDATAEEEEVADQLIKSEFQVQFGSACSLS